MTIREDLPDVDAGNGEPTLASLESELAETRRRLAEAEQTLDAIRNGEVDAIIVHGVAGPQAYTLKTASEPYRHIVEQMPEATLTVTADGLIVYCNAAFANMAGRPAERLAGALLAEFVAPDTMQHLLASGGNSGCDLTLVPLEGSAIDCHASSTELPFGGERVFCCVITNLTGQRLKARHDTIVEASNSAIHMLSPGLVIETWNPAAARFYGYAPAEIIGHSSEALCAPGGFKVLQDRVARARRGEPVSADVVRRRKDGTTFDVMESLAAVRDAAGGISGFASISLDISERVQAVAELQRVSVLLDTLLQTAPLGFCFLDLDLRFVRINERLAEMNGIPAEAHFGRHVSELLPTLVEKLREVTGRILATGDAVLDHEFSGETPAAPGVTRFWCEHWYPVRDGAGEIMGFGAIIEDITKRRRAEAELLDSEARYRALAEASDTIVWRTTPSGDVVFGSNLWNDLTGQTEQEKAGWGWLDAIHPDDRNPTIEKWRAALESRSLYTHEFRIRVADGRYRWFAIRGVPVLNEDGTVREWMCANTDIHERKRAEREIRASEAQLKMALHAARAGAWEAVPNRGEFVASDQALALLDLVPSTAMTHDSAMAMVLPQDRQRVEMELRHTLETGAPYRVELRARQPDGSIRWLLSQAELWPDLEGGRLVGLIQDITEQKQREEQIRLLMGEVNHRSKNLLGVVMSVARQTGGPDNQDFVKRFSDRIQGLAASHDLLVHNEWQSVGLASLVRAQLCHFESLIGTRITIRGKEVSLSPAAAQTIGMALHELATNASKYGALTDDKGRVEICWEVSSSADSPDGRFTFSWRESDGPPVVAPTRHGFGSTVTGKIVKASLSGEVTAEFARSGFVWHLNCPFEKLVADHAHDSS